MVRGSSTRGGITALLEMYRSSTGCHLLVTPDGPQGPRRQTRPAQGYDPNRVTWPGPVLSTEEAP